MDIRFESKGNLKAHPTTVGIRCWLELPGVGEVVEERGGMNRIYLFSGRRGEDRRGEGLEQRKRD